MIVDGINKFLSEVEKLVVAIGIIALSFIVFINVATRFLINWSWVGTEEISKFILIWITFLGSSRGARKGIHVTMSALFDKFHKKTKKIVFLVIAFITSTLSFILAVLGWQLVQLAFKTEQISPALMIPIWPIYMAVPIGLLLTGIQFVRVFFLNIREEGLSFGPEEEGKKEWLDI